jgi:2-octaprenyl-3-methyl-6-methoxy-1,4-benzoquinol hydroxylase
MRSRCGWRIVTGDAAGETCTTLRLTDGGECAARLVIGRQLAGAPDGRNRRSRLAVSAILHADQRAVRDDPGDSTWQQFTPAGPRAFLPLFDNWASLVWYDTPARIRQLQGMSMAQLAGDCAPLPVPAGGVRR